MGDTLYNSAAGLVVAVLVAIVLVFVFALTGVPPTTFFGLLVIGISFVCGVLTTKKLNKKK